MAKKVNVVFEATLKKNPDKGGAWLASVTKFDEGMEHTASQVAVVTAWSNASAGKRWIKDKVQEMTTRKSVKMIPGALTDAKGKPVDFSGQVMFKREI